MPRRGDRSRCVEEDRVARAALLAAEDRPDPGSIVIRCPAEEVLGRAAAEAELLRVDGPLPHRSVDHLADEVRPGR